MNIFFLSSDPNECAKFHNNKHLISQLKESAQLLSTAHRVLDGHQIVEKKLSGRKVKRWKLDDFLLDNALYKATHINHPSAVWVRQSIANYKWLVNLLYSLCAEYTHRYEKIHKVEHSGLLNHLFICYPRNISYNTFTEPPPAMPDIYKVCGDSIQSYRNYYMGAKREFANWKKRPVPLWFQ